MFLEEGKQGTPVGWNKLPCLLRGDLLPIYSLLLRYLNQQLLLPQLNSPPVEHTQHTRAQPSSKVSKQPMVIVMEWI